MTVWRKLPWEGKLNQTMKVILRAEDTRGMGRKPHGRTGGGLTGRSFHKRRKSKLRSSWSNFIGRCDPENIPNETDLEKKRSYKEFRRE